MNDAHHPPHANIPQERSVLLGEIAPSEHVAHFYESESVLLKLLTRYIGSGLLGGEGAIVIATRAHLRALDDRLNASGVYVATSRLTEHYITVDAQDALEKFMVNTQPDEEKFYGFILGLIEPAGVGGRRVRALGEMVRCLGTRGYRGDHSARTPLEQSLQSPSPSSLLRVPKSGIFGRKPHSDSTNLRRTLSNGLDRVIHYAVDFDATSALLLEGSAKVVGSHIEVKLTEAGPVSAVFSRPAHGPHDSKKYDNKYDRKKRSRRFHSGTKGGGKPEVAGTLLGLWDIEKR